MRKKVFILNTGGTISSVQTPQGYEPRAGYLATALAQIPALTNPAMPDYRIHEFDPLLDSSNMQIEDWNRIATLIAEVYQDYDGFVILHGTDTMAYTASALSFMLENLTKPVILTGSQLPLSEVRNDAYDHVVTALWLCAHRPLHEVCVYFNQQLLRGNRCRKISADRFHAFDSPNCLPLAHVGTAIFLHKDRLIPWPDKPFSLQKIQAHAITSFRLTPGFSPLVFDHLLKQPLAALILETFGAGNAPSHDLIFLKALQEAAARGILLINATQCLQGRVAMDQYATGYLLHQLGFISAQDMTPEALYCKLLYLLSKKLDASPIATLLQTNLRGELTDLSTG